MRKRKGKAIPLEQFPYEVLLEIIVRMPTKSLVQLRFTCKFWYALLSDPKVIDMHFHRAKKNPGHISISISMNPFNPSMSVDPLSEYDRHMCYMEMSGSNVQVERLILTTTSDILGSAGGLILCQKCIRTQGEDLEYIINPIIGECVRVPPIKLKSSHHCYGLELYMTVSTSTSSWGFCYSMETKEYVVVKICINGPDKTPWDIYGAIYTLDSGSWREIHDVPYEPSGNDALDYDRTLYWMVREVPDESPRKDIMSFDIVSEKFEAWTLPPDAFIDHRLAPYLAKVEDSVAYVVETESSVRLWMLKEDVWINKYNIDGMRDAAFSCLWLGDKILVKRLEFGRGIRFYSYNVKSGKYRAIRTNAGPRWPLCDYRHLYVASLVSPLKIVANGNKLLVIQD